MVTAPLLSIYTEEFKMTDHSPTTNLLHSTPMNQSFVPSSRNGDKAFVDKVRFNLLVDLVI